MSLIKLQNLKNAFSKYPKTITSIIVFIVIIILHYNSKEFYQADSLYTIHTSLSILNEGNTDIDEYKDLFKDPIEYRLEVIDNHIYNRYPIGASIISLPFVWVASNIFNYDVISNTAKMEQYVSTFLLGICAVIIFLLAMQYLSLFNSILVTLIFSFGTSAWSIASRSLWQNTPSLLCIAVVVLLIVLAKRKPNIIQYISLPLIFSYICRPTNSISILVITIYVFIFYRKYFLKYIMWGAFIGIPFILVNFQIYSNILSPYYQSKIGINPQFFEAFLGQIISPSRGLLIYSPFLIIPLIYVIVKIFKKEMDRIDIVFLLIIFLHHLIISMQWTLTSTWHAGHSYGPRFFTDILPIFIYFLIHSINYFNKNIKKISKTVVTIIFFITVFISVAIHYKGANSDNANFWNGKTFNIDFHTERLWDWHDIPFLRGVDPAILSFFNLGYEKSHIIKTLTEKTLSSLKNYYLNNKVMFNENDCVFYYYGWWAPEASYRWTDEKKSIAYIKLDQLDPEENLFNFNICGSSEKDQRVSLFINDQKVGDIEFHKIDETLSIPIKKGILLSNNVNKLMFEIPNARQRGWFFDQRMIGFTLKYFSITSE